MQIIGHRGAAGLAEENTLKSITIASNMHLDGIEFDVRVTRDHVPVLHHDSFIAHDGDRTAIDMHDYAELQSIFPALTTLESALSQIDGKSTPYIEVKKGVDTVPIVAVLQTFIGGMYSSNDIRIGSKSQSVLRKIHRELPDVPLVVIESWSGVRATFRARELGTLYICMRSTWLWSGFIRMMKRHGYVLSAYTVNSSAEAAKLEKSSLSAIVTDYPDRFVSIVNETQSS